MSNSTAIANKVIGIAPVVLIARGAGFALIILIAHLFGASDFTDAFFVAFAITVVLQFIVATGVSTVATPIMAKLKAERPERLGDMCSSVALIASLCALFTAASLGVALEGSLEKLGILTATSRPLAAWYTLTLAPYAAMATANTVFKAATEIHDRFRMAALAPLARTSIAAVVIWFGVDSLDHYVLPLAYILGGFAEIVLYQRVLTKDKCFLRPTFQLDNEVRQTLKNAAPILAGQSLIALIPLIDRLFAGSLDVGSISALDYADRVRWIPQQFVEFTLIPVAFATWSHGVAGGNRPAYAEQLQASIRWVVALAPPVLLGLALHRYVVISLLFERGLFTADDTQLCADALAGYLPGLLFVMIGGLAVRAHIVEGHLRWVFLMGALSLTLKCLFNWALLSYGLFGLTLASSLVWVAVPSAHLWRLRQTLAQANTKRTWIPLIALAIGNLGLALGWERIIGCPTQIDGGLIWTILCWLICQSLAVIILIREQRK